MFAEIYNEIIENNCLSNGEAFTLCYFFGDLFSRYLIFSENVCSVIMTHYQYLDEVLEEWGLAVDESRVHSHGREAGGEA